MECQFLIPLKYWSNFLVSNNRMEFCWLSWNQKSVPFSQKTLKYIESINIMEDIELLSSQYSFRPICLRNMRMSATILKKGAAAGLTLEEIGKIWCRTDDEGIKPSVFEEIVKSARMRADVMHQDRLHNPLAVPRRKGGLKVKGPISADMETYEKIKALKETEEKKSRVERRPRSNTVVEVDESSKKSDLSEKLIAENGLAVVKENSVEEEKGYGNENELGNMDSSSLEKVANQTSGNDSAGFPGITRTISIPSMLSVNID